MAAGVVAASPPSVVPSLAVAKAEVRHGEEGRGLGAASFPSAFGAGPRARGCARAVASGGARAASASARGPGIEVGRRPYCTVLIVPTGIGAAVGGCAGDALPVARAFAEGADCLITHPNVRGMRPPATRQLPRLRSRPPPLSGLTWGRLGHRF